jgi:hypothetical protein
MNMKNALVLATIVEAGTGLAMLIVPAFVWQLIFGEQLAGVGIPIARVGAMALIGLGIACWPGPPLVGTYSALATLYLAYVAFAGGGARSSCARVQARYAFGKLHNPDHDTRLTKPQRT